MGFNRIGLIGFDFKPPDIFGNETEPKWWTDENIKELNWILARILYYCTENDIEIYNLSLNTRIESILTLGIDKFMGFDNE